MAKDFINDQAFSDELSSLENNDLISVRDVSKSKKHTLITYDNLKTQLFSQVGENVLIDCGTFVAPNENLLIDCGTIV